MKHIYFIDYENVGPKGLQGIESLNLKDELYFFHYVGAGEIKLNNLINMANTNAKTEVVRLSTHQKNAMDFQIVAMLGHLTCIHGNKAEYHIVSKDQGYNSAIECLKSINNELKINTQPSINGCSENQDLENVIKNALSSKLNPKLINKVIKAFINVESLDNLHTYLQREMPQSCQEVYKIIKPIYKEVYA